MTSLNAEVGMWNANEAVGFLLTGCLLLAACTDMEQELAVYAYPPDSPVACPVGSKTGKAGISNGNVTAEDTRFNVRTPKNYDPKIAHPLLVVYSPAGHRAAATENLTHLTKDATSAGFIIAYADHVKNAIPAIKDLATIPTVVAKQWCIDEHRVYLTGHSDGGLVATAIALLDDTRHIPAAIAPSAAGFAKTDFAEFKCRAPLPVMIMHSANDQAFKNFGKDAAIWWASCNRCDADSPQVDADGCTHYTNCAGNVGMTYCEGSGTHVEWPERNQALIDFFKNARQ